MLAGIVRTKPQITKILHDDRSDEYRCSFEIYSGPTQDRQYPFMVYCDGENLAINVSSSIREDQPIIIYGDLELIETPSGQKLNRIYAIFIGHDLHQGVSIFQPSATAWIAPVIPLSVAAHKLSSSDE